MHISGLNLTPIEGEACNVLILFIDKKRFDLHTSSSKMWMISEKHRIGSTIHQRQKIMTNVYYLPRAVKLVSSRNAWRHYIKKCQDNSAFENSSKVR